VPPWSSSEPSHTVPQQQERLHHQAQEHAQLSQQQQHQHSQPQQAITSSQPPSQVCLQLMKPLGMCMTILLCTACCRVRKLPIKPVGCTFRTSVPSCCKQVSHMQAVPPVTSTWMPDAARHQAHEQGRPHSAQHSSQPLPQSIGAMVSPSPLLDTGMFGSPMRPPLRHAESAPATPAAHHLIFAPSENNMASPLPSEHRILNASELLPLPTASTSKMDPRSQVRAKPRAKLKLFLQKFVRKCSASVLGSLRLPAALLRHLRAHPPVKME
jgi:hypothetical protein